MPDRGASRTPPQKRVIDARQIPESSAPSGFTVATVGRRLSAYCKTSWRFGDKRLNRSQSLMGQGFACLQTIWRALEILEINRAGLLRLRQDSRPSPARFRLERIAQSNFDARAKNTAQRNARHRPSGRRRCISQLKREDGRQHAIDHELAVTGDVFLPVRVAVATWHQHAPLHQCLGDDLVIEAGAHVLAKHGRFD